MNNGKIVLALLAGAAAGAALGLLFAPDKGESTRQKLTEGAAGLGKRIMNRGEEMNDTADQVYDAVQNGRSKASRNV